MRSTSAPDAIDSRRRGRRTCSADNRVRPVTVALALVFTTAACGGVQQETQRVKLHIDTDPPGAWVSRIDDTGKQSIGQAPLDTEVVAVRERMNTGPGVWITTGIFAAATAILTPMVFTSDDSATQGIAGGIAISTGVCFLVMLPLAIALQANDGEIISRGYQGTAPTFEATKAGYSSASIVLKPGEDPPSGPIALHLAPSGGGGEGQVLGVLGGSVGGLGMLQSKSDKADTSKRPVMAVFALEDRSKGLSTQSVDQLTDYIAARITEAGRFRVVPRSELRARIGESKSDSYKSCVDESCQIELGKAVAAQKSLATRVIRAGGSCAMTMTLYDLLTEASETAATVRTECTERALMDGIEQLTTRISP